MRDLAAEAGFSVDAYRRIGALEVAGAVGVALGLAVPLLGRLAAAGLLLLLAGALVTHVRKDTGPRKYAPAIVCGVLVAGYLAALGGASHEHRNVPVVIIGAGPTGLTAATLLGQYGVECLVLERWESIYPQPRAVHLDDEIYRILARIGLRDEFAAISRPCQGLRLVDRNMRVLAEFRRGTAEGRHGYPEANMFDQPELEAILRANLTRHASVTLRGNAEVTELTQDGAGPVRVEVTDRAPVWRTPSPRSTCSAATAPTASSGASSAQRCAT